MQEERGSAHGSNGEDDAFAEARGSGDFTDDGFDKSFGVYFNFFIVILVFNNVFYWFIVSKIIQKNIFYKV